MAEKKFSDYTPQEQRGGCIMLLVLFCLIGGCYTCSSNDNRSSNYTHYESNSSSATGVSDDQVYVVAELIIKDKLAAPSTAEFPAAGKVSKRDDGVYVIMSYVDAQNAFGAMLRQYWICQLKYKGGAWDNMSSWEIVEATFM